MKKIVLLFAVLFLFANLSFANTDYNETGNYDGYFQLGTGLFNDVEMQSSADYDTYVKTISSQQQTPLISDLDGDGINEIIILDGATFRLFHDKTLDIVDSYNLPSSERHSNFIAFDIDADGYREIIMVREQSEVLHILEYNGTSFYSQANISLSSLTHIPSASAGDFLIKCESAERCLMAYSEDMDNAPVDNDRLYMSFFNSTDVANEIYVSTSQNVFSVYCFPKIRTMAVADYDNDGTVEFVFSVVDVERSSANEEVQITWANILANNTPVVEQTAIYSLGRVLAIGTTNGNCIDTLAGNIITSPLVFDIDGSISNGLETVIGGMIDADEFKMFSFKSDSSFLDDYPEVFQADGVLISNVIKVNAFGDGSKGDVDFCVMGYDNIDEEIDLLCGSEQNTWSWLGIPYETVEFLYDVTNKYNITQSYDNWNVITHSAQHSTDTYNTENLNEIINSYGVLDIDWDTNCRVQIPPIKCLDLIFENPIGDSVLISVDAEQVGREDLIALSSTNLWYIDDKYSNSPGYISYYYIDPCLDATWKINTSLEVRIKVNNEQSAEDTEDLVSAKAILYYGSQNEQDSGWSANVTAGTTITFSNLLINKTISTSTLRLVGRDDFNPTEEDIIDLTFSVATTGVEFGDCTTEMDIEAPEVEEEIPEECDTDDDCPDGYICIAQECVEIEETAIVAGFDIIGSLLGLSTTLIWLIIMVVTAFGIWTADAAKSHPQTAFGVIIITQILLLIIGTMFGFLGIGVILTIVVMGLIALGLWLGRFMTGANSGGV